MDQEAICILGMHRSGTSLVANIIQQMGVYLGTPENFLSANFANPEGYFENKNIVSIHDSLLTAFGLSWNSPMPLPENWWLAEAAQAASAELDKLISAEFGDCALWGWKDPRTCLLLPVWERVLQQRNINIRYIVPFRNPLDVAKSLALLYGFSLLDGLRLWYYYSITMLSFLKNKNVLFVDYDLLIDQPEMVIAQIHRFIYPGAAEDAFKPAQVSVKKDRRHTKSDTAELGSISQNLLKLYLSLKQSANLQEVIAEEIFANKLGSYREFAWLITPNNVDGLSTAKNIFSSTLFYNTGNIFSEEYCARLIYKLPPDGKILLDFDIIKELDGELSLRWDPIEGAVCRCKVDEILVDGKSTSWLPQGAWRNQDGFDEFITKDPIYLCTEKFDRPQKISIRATLEIVDGDLVLGWFYSEVEQRQSRLMQMQAQQAGQKQVYLEQLALREQELQALKIENDALRHPVRDFSRRVFSKTKTYAKKLARHLPYPIRAFLRASFPKR